MKIEQEETIYMINLNMINLNSSNIINEQLTDCSAQINLAGSQKRTKRAEIHLMKGEDEAFLFAHRANKNRASFSPVGK